MRNLCRFFITLLIAISMLTSGQSYAAKDSAHHPKKSSTHHSKKNSKHHSKKSSKHNLKKSSKHKSKNKSKHHSTKKTKSSADIIQISKPKIKSMYINETASLYYHIDNISKKHPIVFQNISTLSGPINTILATNDGIADPNKEVVLQAGESALIALYITPKKLENISQELKIRYLELPNGDKNYNLNSNQTKIYKASINITVLPDPSSDQNSENEDQIPRQKTTTKNTDLIRIKSPKTNSMHLNERMQLEYFITNNSENNWVAFKISNDLLKPVKGTIISQNRSLPIDQWTVLEIDNTAKVVLEIAPEELENISQQLQIQCIELSHKDVDYTPDDWVLYTAPIDITVLPALPIEVANALNKKTSINTCINTRGQEYWENKGTEYERRSIVRNYDNQCKIDACNVLKITKTTNSCAAISKRYRELIKEVNLDPDYNRNDPEITKKFEEALGIISGANEILQNTCA